MGIGKLEVFPFLFFKLKYLRHCDYTTYVNMHVRRCTQTSGHLWTYGHIKVCTSFSLRWHFHLIDYRTLPFKIMENRLNKILTVNPLKKKIKMTRVKFHFNYGQDKKMPTFYKTLPVCLCQDNINTLFYVKSNLWGSRLEKQKTPTIYSCSSCWLIGSPPGMTEDHSSGLVYITEKYTQLLLVLDLFSPRASEHLVCVALVHNSDGF